MRLSLRTAANIAWRETRASLTKFLFVILAVAAGVGALCGVQGFSASFNANLLDQSRTIMAADLTARQFVPASEREQSALDALSKRGVEHTLITETISMASSGSAPAGSEDATPVLVAIKAVDPTRYPYYGEVKLDPPLPLAQALAGNKIIAAQDTLLRLNAKVGDSIRIGTGTFQVAAVTITEPDRMSGSMNVGLRLMMSRESMQATGLMGFGSRAAYRYLFHMSPTAPKVEEVRASLREALPDALIADFRQSNPIITRGLDRATTFLSLISLISMIVGAIGVGMAMHVHLQQKMDTIAVLKSLGATSRDVVGIYVLQTLLLGSAGGVLGVVIGKIVERAFPFLISRYFQFDIKPVFSVAASVEGVAVGLLTTLLFTLPPLLAVRKIRPAMILRRDMAEVRGTLTSRLKQSSVSLALGAVIVSGLGLIAGWLAQSARVGGYFAAGLVASLILLALIASGFLRGIRSVVKNAPFRVPTLARQGFANLYRQGNQAQAILVALGLGVMFTLTVYLVQRSLVAEIIESAPPGAPNVLFIGITPEQVDPLKALIAQQKGVLAPPEFGPSVPVRIEKINTVSLEELRATTLSRRFRGSRSVMFSAEKPSSLTVIEGAWWNAKESRPVVSIEEEAARTLGIRVGAIIEISGGGINTAAKVVALHRVEQMRIGAANEFVFNPPALNGMPATFYGGVRMQASEVGALERAAYQAFPTVTVINIVEALAIVQQVVDQVALVIRFLSAFSILAGAIILAASVAGTRFRRMREVVILKTLGATRAAAGRIFSVEFLTLGLVAGVLGALLATIFARVLLARLLDAPFAFDIWPNVIAVVLTAVLAQAAGWLASFRILRQKPLEVLREE